MSKQIIPFDELRNIGRAMAQSGYFQDASGEAQAIVKVLAGSEIGLGPFAAMTGIHVIKGKPVLGSNLIATLIKNDPRYNYRVTEHTAEACEIEFFENGDAIGTSRVTIDELRRAGSHNLDKYPKNMLFARAISNGAKWHTPGVFGGTPVYTPDEFGLSVDEDGEVIDVTPTPQREVAQKNGGSPAPEPELPQTERPYSPVVLRDLLLVSADRREGEELTEGQAKMLAPNLEGLFPGDENAADKRHALTEYLFGATSTKDLNGGQSVALWKWIGVTKNDAGEWLPNFNAIHEAAAVYAQHMKDSGQHEMFAQ